MKIETPIITVILAGVVFAGLFGLIFSLADQNDITYDLTEHESENGTAFYDAFNTVNSTKSEMDDIIEDFEGQTVDDSGSIFSFISLTFSMAKQFFNSLGLFKSMAVLAGQFLGVPSWIAGALVSIVLISIIVSIILLIAGRSQ